MILLHGALAGPMEIMMQCAAFFAARPQPFVTVAVVMAFGLHIPTAIAQVPNVFGVKMFTIPFYICFIAMHVWTSYHLWCDPTNPVMILKQSVALHGYAWVRLMLFLFRNTNTIRKHEEP